MSRLAPIRNLVLVLGDQLDPSSSALDGLDRAADAVWMAEAAEESTRVWSHKARIAMFLAAMRHFRDALRRRGIRVEYRRLDDREARGTLGAELAAAVERLRPQRLIVAEPGEWRVREGLLGAAGNLGVPLDVRPDRRFLSTREEFAAHARGRKQLRMEFFYREMRRRHGVLMDGESPAGGAWNLDAENRESFGDAGPPEVPSPRGFPPDAVTREVIRLVERRFPGHPGTLSGFDWPMTPRQAKAALDDFVENRLSLFGRFQDAMWAGEVPGRGRRRARGGGEDRREAFLYHSRLSPAMNLGLLDPRDVISAAEEAYRAGAVPLASAEGFIRQVLGWREYVRGIYWGRMPGYLEMNALGAAAPLPAFYWTGDTGMRCLARVIGQTLAFGYAHHIQRLMVTGLFALLLGVRPQAVHEWYLAVYVDAVEWVEAPNTLGMSQFADGGLMASKPYAATGKYIRRMSDYCAACRYDPAMSAGPDACPFTTLYWDFLLRNESALRGNPRMAMQLGNLRRLGARERAAARVAAEKVRSAVCGA